MEITDWLAVIRLNNRKTYVCKISAKGLYAMTNVINYQRVKDVLDSDNKDLSRINQWIKNGNELDRVLEEEYSGVMINVQDLIQNNDHLKLRDVIEINIHDEKIDVNEINNIYLHSLKQEKYKITKKEDLNRSIQIWKNSLINYTEPSNISGVTEVYNWKDAQHIDGFEPYAKRSVRRKWMETTKKSIKPRKMIYHEATELTNILEDLSITNQPQLLWENETFNKMWKTRNLENLITKSGETK